MIARASTRRVRIASEFTQNRKRNHPPPSFLETTSHDPSQAQQITWILKLPMKGTIDAIMDEEVECFPRAIAASRRVGVPSLP
jgi:hypothetical protein